MWSSEWILLEQHIYDNEIERFYENNQSAQHEEIENSPSKMKLKKICDLGLIIITSNNCENLKIIWSNDWISSEWNI